MTCPPGGARDTLAPPLVRTYGFGDLRTAYDTTELATETGELLHLIAEDLISGWLGCRPDQGREGWVPVNTVEAAG